MSENSHVEFKLNDQSRDFLLYAYFGIVAKDMYNAKGEKVVSKDTREDAVRKCVDRAYLDMCRTLLLRKDKESKNDNSFRKKYGKQLVDILSETNTPGEMRKEAYEKFFDEQENPLKGLADYLSRKEYADPKKRQDKCFYYGQFQKWINMSLKYMWLIGLLDSPEGLEVPLDRYILKAASKELKIPLPCDDGTEDFKEYKEGVTMPWSKLSKEEYGKIISGIQAGLEQKGSGNPIAWECDAWIIQAKLDNKIEQ